MAERAHAGIILETDSLLPVGEMLRRMTRMRAELQSLEGRLIYLGDYR